MRKERLAEKAGRLKVHASFFLDENPVVLAPFCPFSGFFQGAAEVLFSVQAGFFSTENLALL